MNTRNLFKLGALLVVLFLVATVTGFAQLSTVYVNSTNGSDSYTGEHAVNSPAKTGPKATIKAGLKIVADGGTLVIAAGDYVGFDNANSDFVINATNCPNVTSGFTIQLAALNSNTVINVTNGNFIMNFASVTVAITRLANENITFSESGANGNVTLTAGSVNFATSDFWVMKSDGVAPPTITINGGGSFTTAGPKKGATADAVILSYIGTGTINAGGETAMGDYKAGTLTVNRTLATDAVNFGASAMTFASVTITNGTVTFGGALTLKSGGNLALAGAGTKTFNGNVTMNAKDITNSGTGAVSFNGASVAMKEGDIRNTGTGALSFSASTAVTFVYDNTVAAQTNLGQVFTSSGSITFNGPVSWSSVAAGMTAARDFMTAGWLAVENAGGTTCSVIFAQGMTFNSPANDGLTATGGTTLNNFGAVMKVKNTGTGTLTLGTINTPTDPVDEGLPAITNHRFITMNVENASTGTMSLDGTIYGYLQNTAAASGTITLTGATEVDGVLTNGATKTIDLGVNTLTLAGAVTQLTNGGTIEASSGFINATATMTFNGGTLPNLTVKAGKTVSFTTNSTTVGNLTINGSVTVAADIVLTATNVSQTGTGTLTLANDVGVNGGYLVVLGDLNRTGGTFFAGSKSQISFEGTSGAQNVNAGPNFLAVNVLFNNAVGPVTLSASMRASGNVEIKDNCTVNLGTYNLIMIGATTSFNVNTTGRYTATGGGGLVLGGINTVVGGTAVTGISLLGSGGTYSYITVDVGLLTNTVTANSTIKFDGVLTLRSGQLVVAGGKDVSPIGTSATVVRYIDVAPGISGTFNTLHNPYALTYTGQLTADRAVGAELTVYVNTWNIDVDCEGGAGAPWRVDLLGTANTNFGGDLTIGKLARLRIPTNGATVTFKLTKVSGNHVIKGRFETPDAADMMLINGNNSTVTGSTVSAEPAIVGNFGVDVNATVTIASVKSFTGTFTTGSGSEVTLGMGSTSADQIIVGAVSLGGNSLTLSTSIEVQGGVTLTFATGAMTFGSNTLTVSTAGGFTGNASTNTYGMSSGGELLMKVGPLNLAGATITNLEIDGAVALGGDAVVSGTFTHTSGALTLTGYNLTIGGTSTYKAGSYVGTTGAATDQVIFTTTGKATFNASVTIPNITLNSPGTVTFATGTSDGKAITVTITGVFTHTLGTLSLGINNLVLSYTAAAAYQRASGAGTITASSGIMEFNGATQTYTAGSDNAASITNLKFSGTTSLTNTNNLDVLTITGTLYLTKGAFNAASGTSATTLVLADGATIDRLNGTLTKKPVYANQVNIKYSSLGTTFSGADLVAGGLTVTTNTPASAGTIFSYPAHGLSNGDLVVMTLGSGGDPSDKANYDGKVCVVTKIDANNFTLRVAKSSLIVVFAAAGPGGDLHTLNAATAADNIVIGNEFPISSQTTVLKDLTLDRGTTVSIDRNVTVNGTLNMFMGRLDRVAATPSWVLTIAPNGTIVKQGEAIWVFKPVVTTYNLTYSGGYNVTTTSNELQSGTGITITTVTVSGTNTVLYLGVDLSMANLVLNASGGGVSLLTTDNKNGRTLTVSGDVTLTAGNFLSGILADAATTNPTLTFAGTVPQKLTVPAAGWTLTGGTDFAPANGSFLDAGDTPAIYIQVNNTAAADKDKVVTLTGGNFTMGTGGIVQFVSGVISTGANVWTLAQGNNPATNQPTQGFSRALATGAFGHFVGNVKKYINNTTGAGGTSVDRSIVTFPVGTMPASPGYYRPFSIYFKTAPQSAVNITVSHVNSRPGGSNGFPIRDGGLVITNYPDFFWYVKSDVSLAPSYLFDMEAQAEGYTDYASDGIQNLRFVRRDSGLVSNQWVMQKNNNTGTVLYDNSTIAANWPAVKVIDATGGLTTQGSLFTYSQINKAPSFTVAPTNFTKDEGDSVSVTFTAVDPDLGDALVMSAVTKPVGSTFDASTGIFTWKIGYDVATKATPTDTVTVTIRATDTYGPLSKDTTIKITVNNKNRAPVFSPRTITSTPKDTDTLTVALAATDADGDALTYTLIGTTPTPTNVPTVTGTTLTWIPAFADVGIPFAIKTLVSDGAGGTDTLTVSATVSRSRARGDVDGDGRITNADATAVLKHVAGITLITDPAALYAADATKDGTISAFDAAYILQAAANLITLPASADVSLAKGLQVSGSLSWGAPEATKEPDVVKVGLKLSNAANVYSAQLTSQADFSLLTVEGVSAAIPEGWEMQWNVIGNELRIAMAGTTPLSSGDIGAITIRMKNKESRLNFSTDALLNENFQSLGAVEIAAVPTVFALQQNYPNPFNPSTTIKYQIPQDANVTLVIWNVQGQQIRTLVAKEQKAGYYNAVWDGRNEAGQTVSSGFYLYRVQAGSFVAVHKMMLLK